MIVKLIIFLVRGFPGKREKVVTLSKEKKWDSFVRLEIRNFDCRLPTKIKRKISKNVTTVEDLDRKTVEIFLSHHVYYTMDFLHTVVPTQGIDICILLLSALWYDISRPLNKKVFRFFVVKVRS